MKRIFIQRPEPLLIVVPLILLLLHKIFIGNSPADIPGEEHAVLQLNTAVIFWIVFAFIIVPFQLHFLLRASRKWDAVFCRPHVYLTITLLVVLFILFHVNLLYHARVPGQYFDGSVADQYTDSWSCIKISSLLFLIELVVQCLFTIYFLITIFQKTIYKPTDK